MTGKIFRVSDASFVWKVPYINKNATGNIRHTAYSPRFECEGQTWKFHMFESQDELHFCIYRWSPYSHRISPSTHSYKFEIKRSGSVYCVDSLITDTFSDGKHHGQFQVIPECSLSEVIARDPNDVLHIQVTFISITESGQHKPEGSNSTISSSGISKEVVKTYPNLQQPNVLAANPGPSNSAGASFRTSEVETQDCSNDQLPTSSSLDSHASNSTAANFRTLDAERKDCTKLKKPTIAWLHSYGSNQKEDSSRTSGTQKRLNFH